ncbi:MAG: hypothetical protein ABIJ18_04010 [archaeon]
MYGITATQDRRTLEDSTRASFERTIETTTKAKPVIPRILRTQEEIDKFWKYLPYSNSGYNDLDINLSLAKFALDANDFKEARTRLRDAKWVAKWSGYYEDYKDHIDLLELELKYMAS